MDRETKNSVQLLLADAKTAAVMLSVSRSGLYSMHRSGRLGPLPIHFGKRTLWRTEELASWVREGCPRREIWANLRAKTPSIAQEY